MVFVKNPSAVLSGAAVEIDDEPPAASKKWYHF
jgi:hypothetical protein